MELEPADLLISSIKRAEERESLVVRLFNPTAKEISGCLTLGKEPTTVRYLTLDEKPVEGGNLEAADLNVAVTAGAKKIVTLEISFA